MLKKAEQESISIVCFPELCITGYTCGDLFLQDTLLNGAIDGLKKIIDAKIKVTAIVGLPLTADGVLYNCAAVVYDGQLLGIVPKKHIPNYNEYYEKRHFDSGVSFPDSVNLFGEDISSGLNMIFTAKCGNNEVPFAIEICEDLWAPSPPSAELAQKGALIIFNPSASTALAAKHQYRKSLISIQSGKCISGYIYASVNFDESTQDVVFSGYCGIYENGRLLSQNKTF